MDAFQLPAAPDSQTGLVKAWSQPVLIPTYLPDAPDKNPMFLDKRVYQGSSGKIYPLPFYNRIASEKVPHLWKALHLENEYVRIMILPEIGGRIHVALDKTNGYDFIYRQNVIKPALVGLAGPWISGGIEFNWPQHHRPATFMPADWSIEEHDDGSKTIWLSQHDPLTRMKGMHGVCLHPGKSYIELKARLFNRTPFRQTFLWWANVATRVHEQYQSFFPGDVSHVADHAKRAMSTYPLCDGHYYGVDYATRAKENPDQPYAANDLSWYANIPVPTSYMCMGTKEDFFGGYDHRAQAGIIHIADHHIAPGKKQWTWGNHAFGYAWDRLLTDEDGPYIELMAGVFTDNQPDFSFLAPYETRTFSQYWYPIRNLGAANYANLSAAVSLKISSGIASISINTTSSYEKISITLSDKTDRVIKTWDTAISPEMPFSASLGINKKLSEHDLVIEVKDKHQTLLRYAPIRKKLSDVPPPATEPDAPEMIQSIDELYLTGLHLHQYRHATRMPENYWIEALKRDPEDSRCNTAMGYWHLHRGEFADAIQKFSIAVQRLTYRNPNPEHGDAHYGLGLAHRYSGNLDSAYEALAKSCWNAANQTEGNYELALLDCRNKNWHSAFDKLKLTLRRDSENTKAGCLLVIVLRRLFRMDEAAAILKKIIARDPLDFWVKQLSGESINCAMQTKLDVALDYASAGLYDEAMLLLDANPNEIEPGTEPLRLYYLAYFSHQSGNDPKPLLTRAAQAPIDYCFPARLEEIATLQFAIDQSPGDSKARYLLGNLYYDRKRYNDAIRLWEESVKINPHFATAWRNLGIAYYNLAHQSDKAEAAYENACACDPTDARLLYERDQLYKRLGKPAKTRLEALLKYPRLIESRDDLSIELCDLLNQTGQHEAARKIISTREFQPWEGGEGMALQQHTVTHLSIGRQLLDTGHPDGALKMFQHALSAPENLGEARHLLANCSDIHYWIGMAAEASGDEALAKMHWQIAADFKGDFIGMSVRSFSEITWFSAMSMHKLGRTREAKKLLKELQQYAENLEKSPAKIDYFATSLPTMLLFEEDLQARQTESAKRMLQLSQTKL